MALINLRNALMTKRLSYDAEVEYLESTGDQYINTGIIGGSSSKVEISASSTNTAQNMGLFGSRNASLVKAFTIWQRVTNTSVRFDFADDTTNRVIANAAWDTSGVNTVVKDGTNNTLNGVAGANNATATFTCEYPFYLFSINTAGTATSNASARVYSCKIWQNGTLVRDLIPVRKGTVGYLYDRVSGLMKPFGNAGTGDFVLGPDVVPVEYIESHGTEWIDTGIVGGSNTVWECDAALTSTSVSNVVGQSYNSGGYKCRFAFGASADNLWYAGLGDLNNFTNVNSDTSRHLFVLSSPSKKFIIDNTEYPTRWVSWSYPASTIGGIALFGRRLIDNGAVSPYARMRMWGSKIYDNSTPLRSFRPVRVGTDATSWEGAMMDVLTRRIYRNAGTGAFTYGNDLKYPIPAE